MPSAPPSLKQRPKSKAWASTRKSRQDRGYGRAHEQMRAVVLREEPLCRICLAMAPPRYTPTTIADHIVPIAEGGSSDRDNYQGACGDCHARKTAEEAARARGAKVSRKRIRIGADGWPRE